MALTTVSNAGLAGSIDLTAKVTGTLPIANGGTNSTSTTYCDVTANVTGALPIANGGTAATTLAAAGLASTPSFFAYLSADQTLSDGVATKIQIDTEIYDTDGCYDNSSNYRFTPTTAGKYLTFGSLNLFCDSSNLKVAMIMFYKNGALLYETHDNFTANYLRGVSQTQTIILDMNGSSDYVEIYGKIEGNSTPSVIKAENGDRRCSFGAYKVIGV